MRALASSGMAVTPRVGCEPPRGAWLVIAAYGLLAAATQLLWLTYAAITTDAARRYGVSVGAIGWLSEIFPLLYVVLGIPAGRLLDRGLRPALAVGGALVAVGGLLRLGGESFAWAICGQALVAIAQPLVMSAVSKLAGEYLPASERADGIAAASAAGFVGMLLALLLGPAFGGAHLMSLLAVEAAVAVVAAVGMGVALLKRPVARVSERASIERGVARALWRQSAMKILCALVFIGFGIFVALSTWLQTLLHPGGVSDTAAGLLLVGMLIAGIVGCAVFPPLVERAGLQRAFMVSVVGVGAACALVLALVSEMGARAGAMVAIGLVLVPALPVILTLAERLAGPASGTAGALVWLAGNLGGVLVAVLVEALVHHPAGAFFVLAGVGLCGLPFALRMTTVTAAAAAYRRGRVESLP